MKVAALILLCGVAFAAAVPIEEPLEVNENGCPVDTTIHYLLPHKHCNQFYQCVHGEPVAITCVGSLLYNPEVEVCDWPQSVDCGERVIPEPEDEEDVEKEEVQSMSNRFFVSPDNKLEDAQIKCLHRDSEGLFVEHQLCNSYYVCSGGIPVEHSCPNNLFFNANLETCDFRLSVDCGERTLA